MLSDLFGVNGRRILDALAGGVSRESILASLTGHVAAKAHALGDALSLELRPAERTLLRALVTEFDFLGELIADIDHDIRTLAAPWTESLHLLMTLPGVDISSACAILAEVGPHPRETFTTCDRLAAWAGLCPGNHESAGKRLRLVEGASQSDDTPDQ